MSKGDARPVKVGATIKERHHTISDGFIAGIGEATDQAHVVLLRHQPSQGIATTASSCCQRLLSATTRPFSPTRSRAAETRSRLSTAGS
ncbi:MAG: Uncharacterised protein [Cyanobium sp. ARS6]|nr:MAG: Uncharacterised protein [Cyanobium sp. ARS6]